MPTRPCLGLPGHPCPHLTTRPDHRCPTCATRWHQARDTHRGSRQARGYGAAHDRLRQAWSPLVEAGHAECQAIVCLEDSRRIKPGSAWDLGHSDDRTTYHGPEHARCNRAAGAQTTNDHHRQ